jgi:hypothetical protein
MKLLFLGSLAALSIAGASLASPALAQPVCKQGYVWREAFSGDTVCVSVQRRRQVADENAAAASRRDPHGGAYGPNTCLPGFVWRAAAPNDLVCVPPPSRDLAAEDNAASASHTAAAAPAPAPAASAYQLSAWSGWNRIDGAEYRYRWGWNPRAANFPGTIDALFEVHNRLPGNWTGAARSITCTSNTLGASAPDVTLRPGETRSVKFTTTNCGSRDRPFFKPSVVRSSTL